MAVLRRADLPAPALRQEEVEVPALGGAVIVRAMPLNALFDVIEAARAAPANAVPSLLAASVIDADGEQFWTAEQWATWGATEFEGALALYQAAQRVCGIGKLAQEATEKN
jgi:hypothetical protein